MKRWRRPLLILPLLLLGGAVANVAVAWALAPATKSYQNVRDQRDVAWSVRPPLPSWPVVCERSGGWWFGFEYRSESAAVDDYWRVELDRYSYGLPFLSMAIIDEGARGGPPRPGLQQTPVPDLRRGSARLGLPDRWRPRVSATPLWALPVSPLFPGFLLNTLFYAGLLGLPLLCFPLRRIRRRAKGRCEECNYVLAGLEACPECGAAR
jgi:hypothetical protein